VNYELSPAALAFVQDALVVDPKQRPTPTQLLLHPYLQEDALQLQRAEQQHVVCEQQGA
jgi:serine/threonine protein kinase